MKNKKNKNPYIGQSWDDFVKENCTSEEIDKMNKYVEFYGVVIKLRKKFGLTQREMSDKVGMKQPMLARFEKGDNIPKITTAQKILKPFGLSLAIVTEADEKVIYKFD